MTADFGARTEELRALALEIRDRYDLMLRFDLDSEDADLHRELMDLANEALEDIAMAEAGLAAVGPQREAERRRPTLAQLWAEWNSTVCFQRRRTLTPKLKAGIIGTFRIGNYRGFAL